ncbi:MAG: chemotaxis response regulator protein-glutamate methylesterase [Planctomycetaceae bacterium]|jgi:two-component system, chemotaxis family, protein-glutamate methylesterase/glutaminase|nr:chemotaxis response regulator protein-glutamate methylesterase [Planctomycetaceae bacterium]MBT6486338.1 chemotaxis response regulator protein-glutamate methylesterase [Planctomycetaceae bacterium]MBT6493262.1 chemotaxis response regulator protein-glutamate methylesterase [Planctomycetaceae bacterium]
MSQQQIQVLVVDDSAVVRGLIARALETDPAITVAGTAMHGEAALTWMRKHPVDVVILDVEMPVMDGLTALGCIQSEFPRVKVIMASALTQEGAETTVKALALGAADCIAKPVSNSTADSISQLLEELAPLVKALGRHTPERSHARSTRVASHRNSDHHAAPLAVVIGTSTGGPNALTSLLTALPTDFPLPILIVQHMPPTFTPMLAKHLGQDTGRPCIEAIDGGLIERGHTYVAPGDYHLFVDKQEDHMVTRLNQGPKEHYCRPSVNPLFESAAEWYRKSLLAVMLTGMGDDGIEGTRKIVASGGQVIAQDEESSVVWGMPGAVVNENLAQSVLPLEEIASAILELTTAEIGRR